MRSADETHSKKKRKEEETKSTPPTDGAHWPVVAITGFLPSFSALLSSFPDERSDDAAALAAAAAAAAAAAGKGGRSDAIGAGYRPISGLGTLAQPRTAPRRAASAELDLGGDDNDDDNQTQRNRVGVRARKSRRRRRRSKKRTNETEKKNTSRRTTRRWWTRWTTRVKATFPPPAPSLAAAPGRPWCRCSLRFFCFFFVFASFFTEFFYSFSRQPRTVFTEFCDVAAPRRSASVCGCHFAIGPLRSSHIRRLAASIEKVRKKRTTLRVRTTWRRRR